GRPPLRTPVPYPPLSRSGTYLEGLPTPAVCVLVTLIYSYVRYFFASATAHISALFPVSLALLILAGFPPFSAAIALGALSSVMRSEEHTSELQSRANLVC